MNFLGRMKFDAGIALLQTLVVKNCQLSLAYFPCSRLRLFLHSHIRRGIIHRKLRIATKFGNQSLFGQHLTFTTNIITPCIVYVE